MTQHPEAFDAALLGAGQANNPLSRSLARAGKRVAQIEKSKIGGMCVNTDCTPTRTVSRLHRRKLVALGRIGRRYVDVELFQRLLAGVSELVPVAALNR